MNIKDIIIESAKTIYLNNGKIRYPHYYERNMEIIKKGKQRYSEQEIKQYFVLKALECLDDCYLTFETPTKYGYAFHLKEPDDKYQPECDCPECDCKRDSTRKYQSGQIDVSIWKNNDSDTAYSHIEFKHIPKTNDKKPKNRKKVTKDLLKLSVENSESGINYFVFVIYNDKNTWNALKVLLFDENNYKMPVEDTSIYKTVSKILKNNNREIKIIVFDREKGIHLGTFDYAETLSNPDEFSRIVHPHVTR